MRTRIIENVAKNVQKILKAAAPRRTKNYFTFKLAVILLEICFPLSLYIFLSFRFIPSHSLSLSLTHWCARLIYYSARQKKNSCILFNNRSANLYDGNREHFYSLIFILTTSASTRVVFHISFLFFFSYFLRLVEDGKTFLSSSSFSFFMFSNYPLFIYSSS